MLLLQIQEAYETLIKRRGQPKGAEPQAQDSWDFHDWCVWSVGSPFTCTCLLPGFSEGAETVI